MIVPPRATITNKAKDMESKTIYEVPGLKVSYKMRKSIEILERNYRILNKRFFVERNKDVRVGRGFYDGCQITSPIFKSLDFVVAHDGTIS